MEISMVGDYENLVAQARQRLEDGRRIDEPVARTLLNKLIALIDLYEFSPVAYLSLNRQGMIINCNHTTAEALGTSRTGLLGRHLYEFIVPAQRDLLFYLLETLSVTSGRQHCELTLAEKNGKEWQNVRLDVYADRDDEDREVYRATLSDITEQRMLRAEAERNRTLLQTVIERMPAGLYLIDAATGEILLRNRAAKKLCRLGIDEDLHQKGALQPGGTPLAMEDYPFERARRSRRPVSQQNMCFRGENGEMLHLAVSAAPLFERDEGLTAVVLVFDNITGLKETEARLRRSSEELRLA